MKLTGSVVIAFLAQYNPSISLSDELKYPFTETICYCSKCGHFGVDLRNIRNNTVGLLQSPCVPQEAEAINHLQ